MRYMHQLFNSLQFQLILWSILSLLLLAVVAGGYGFWYSYHEINDFQDDNLKSVATALEQIIVSNPSPEGKVKPNIHFNTDSDDSDIQVDILNVNQINHSNDNYPLEKPNKTSVQLLNKLVDIPIGISTQKIDKKTWRVYRLDNHENTIIVRQRTEFRDDLARTSALQSSLPLLLGIALISLLLPFIMWYMLKPVRKLHQEVNQRHENDLSPMSLEKLPTELVPLVASFNHLLELVNSSIHRQQRFIADAAHELRSPLTAISLQLQRLQRVTTDETTSAGLDKLAVRLKRNQQLVEQMLTLARIGNVSQTAIIKPVAIKPVIEQVISLLLPIADNKDIELMIDLQVPDTTVHIDETALLLVIKNLIQNAILYTPHKGQVMVRLSQFSSEAKEVEADEQSLLYSLGTHVIQSTHADNLPQQLTGRLLLQVMDTGKGIASTDYKQVFEPFVRLSQTATLEQTTRSDSATMKTEEGGTGLGLSIVKTVCEQSAIDVFMNSSILTNSNSTENKGLCVSLVF